VRFLADENFDNDILKGVRRRIPEFECLRAQDTDLMGRPDQEVLAWAAEHDYVLLSHDVNTMPGYYQERLDAGLPVPILFLAHQDKPIGQVIGDLVLIVGASEETEWQGRIEYLPFQ